MPKARNSKVDEALALYRQGLKLIEISRKLDIPEGTPGHPVTRTPRSSASCPNISQRRHWNCCT